MRSQPEMLMETLLREAKITTVPEYRFHSTRRWRFDFAIPDKKIAIEIEGGTWSGGRHTRGGGFRKDCEKYNTAAGLGWKIFRFTSDMVYDMTAIEFLKKNV
jgi:very-short-patch-repair endonuclease